MNIGVGYRRVIDLKRGDLISDDFGFYVVTAVGTYKTHSGALPEYTHVSVSTLAGKIIGGMMRSPSDYVRILDRVDPGSQYGAIGMEDPLNRCNLIRTLRPGEHTYSTWCSTHQMWIRDDSDDPNPEHEMLTNRHREILNHEQESV